MSGLLGRLYDQMDRKTHQDADIQGLGHPVAWNAGRETSRYAVNIAGGRSAVVVDVAGQTGLVVGIADQEHSLDRGELRAREHGQSVNLS